MARTTVAAAATTATATATTMTMMEQNNTDDIVSFTDIYGNTVKRRKVVIDPQIKSFSFYESIDPNERKMRYITKVERIPVNVTMAVHIPVSWLKNRRKDCISYKGIVEIKMDPSKDEDDDEEHESEADEFESEDEGESENDNDDEQVS